MEHHTHRNIRLFIIEKFAYLFFNYKLYLINRFFFFNNTFNLKRREYRDSPVVKYLFLTYLPRILAIFSSLYICFSLLACAEILSLVGSILYALAVLTITKNKIKPLKWKNIRPSKLVKFYFSLSLLSLLGWSPNNMKASHESNSIIYIKLGHFWVLVLTVSC